MGKSYLSYGKQFVLNCRFHFEPATISNLPALLHFDWTSKNSPIGTTTIMLAKKRFRLDAIWKK
jgi:hypothetical protein